MSSACIKKHFLLSLRSDLAKKQICTAPSTFSGLTRYKCLNPTRQLGLQHSHKEAPNAEKLIEKPDLRAAGQSHSKRAQKVIAATVLLAFIYMYPSIFRPMLGLHERGQGSSNIDLESLFSASDRDSPKVKLAKAR